jgi:hypothetical protein
LGTAVRKGQPELVISTPKTFLTLTLATAVLALGAGAATAQAASAKSSAKTPCWKTLINDWYDGRIDHAYPVHCYKDALKHLPSDVRTYSDAYDVISRALASATRGKKHVNVNALVPPPGSGGGTTTGGGKTGGGKTGGGKTGGGKKRGTTTTVTTTPVVPGSTPQGNAGLFGDATSRLGSSRADAVPIPLLVLAGLALLLVAAGGAGLVARRLQGRRARP